MTGDMDRWRAYQVEAWLMDVGAAVDGVRCIERVIEERRAQAENLRSMSSGSVRGGDPARDAIGDAVAIIDELESRLDAMMGERGKMLVRAESAFARCSDPIAGKILPMRYFEHARWDDIASALEDEIAPRHCGERQLRNIADSAKLELYDLMPAEYRTRVPSAI